MKILWICQKLPPEAEGILGGERELKNTGGWILGMAGELLKQNDIHLAILACSSMVDVLTEVHGEQIVYYVIPFAKNDKDEKILGYCKIVQNQYNPDIVHIHGSEYVEGLLWTNANGIGSTVVSLQGILTSYSDYYYEGMSQWDVLSNITLRDLLRGSIFENKREFRRRSAYEQNLLQKVHYVIGRTFWDKEQLWRINPLAQYCFNNEVLRDEFYDGQIWSYELCKKNTIFVNQAAVPYKGLHQLIKALPIIKLHCPDVSVRVAGFNVCDKSIKRRILRTGYGKYLLGLMRTLNVEEIVSFIGPLNAREMRDELLSANLFLLPSAIENSPNALGEAQMLGVPLVASAVGGVADMIPNSSMGKMYRFSDIGELAYAVCNALVESSRFENIIMRKVAMQRHDKLKNVTGLIDIYKLIMNDA